MKNAVQVFENAEFGRVRTIEVKGSPYFVGKDVAEILGYSNPQKAISDHVDDEDRTVNDSFTVNGTKGLLINSKPLSMGSCSTASRSTAQKKWKHGGTMTA